MSPVRKRTPASVVIACLVLSAGLNYVGLHGGTLFFNQERTHHYSARAKVKKSCVPGDTRAVNLLTSSLSGDRVGFAGKFGEFVFGAECPPEPMEVALLDEPPEELAPEIPPPEELPPPELERPKPTRERLQEEKKEKELEEEKEKPKPEPQPEPEPEPQPEEEKPDPIDFQLEQLKMVEQMDQFDEEEAPEDINYLSNINRDVQEETRAEITNLVQDAEIAKASQQEPSELPEPGMANEDVIAELEQREAQLAKEAPRETPSPEEQRPEQSDPKPESLLAMREQAPRDHSEAMTANDALASAAEDGDLAPDRSEQASIQKQNQQARTDTHDKKYKFKLSQNDLDAVYGLDPDKKRDYLAARQSKRKGVWEDSRARWQSPLENMVPEVKPGNQTALRSRKHPFARFIAQMHRKIHDLWAWGYLDGLDTRSRNHPLNDEKLWSRVEIVLHGDGRIDKVRTVRTSGNLVFDAAAREIIYAAAPFPSPPGSIRSGNGKIYIHWAFHRDARACGTFGAEPFILDNAGNGDRPDPNREVHGTTSEGRAAESRRLAKRFKAAPGNPEGPAAPSQLRRSPGGGHGGGGSHAGHNHGPGGHGGGGGGGTGRTRPSSEGPRAPGGGGGVSLNPRGGSQPAPLQPGPETVDPKVEKVASAWLRHLTAGEVGKLGTRSSLPFYAGDQIVARTQEELKGVLQSMIDETRESGRKGRSTVKIYTAAGLRKQFGSVPPGVSEGRGRMFAVARIGGQTTILMLEQRFGAWRVVGLSR